MPVSHHSLWRRLITGQARGPAAAIARLALSFASLFYSAAVRLRNKFYDWGVFRTHKLPVPVISVGNITLGGTGKTPLVELVCRKLLAAGRKPAILTRGYKAGRHGSDEALMLAEHLPTVPVIVNPDRVAGGREAITEHGADVLVMDDGFQHRRLHRDWDICLVPTSDGPELRMLPRGIMREPAKALGRAHVRVRVRSDCSAAAGSNENPFPCAADVEAVRAATDILWIEDGAAPVVRPVESLRDRDLLGFCGLGDPAGFERTLADIGRRRVEVVPFADHHPYSPGELADLGRRRVAGAATVTTEKDHQRLLWLSPAALKPILPLAVVRIRMEIVGGQAGLDAALGNVLEGRGCINPASRG